MPPSPGRDRRRWQQTCERRRRARATQSLGEPRVLEAAAGEHDRQTATRRTARAGRASAVAAASVLWNRAETVGRRHARRAGRATAARTIGRRSTSPAAARSVELEGVAAVARADRPRGSSQRRAGPRTAPIGAGRARARRARRSTGRRRAPRRVDARREHLARRPQTSRGSMPREERAARRAAARRRRRRRAARAPMPPRLADGAARRRRARTAGRWRARSNAAQVGEQELAAPGGAVGAVSPCRRRRRRAPGPSSAVLGHGAGDVRVMVLHRDRFDRSARCQRVARREVVGVQVVGDDLGRGRRGSAACARSPRSKDSSASRFSRSPTCGPSKPRRPPPGRTVFLSCAAAGRAPAARTAARSGTAAGT